VKSKKDIVFNIAHLIDSLHLIKIISREQTLTYAKQHRIRDKELKSLDKELARNSVLVLMFL